MLDVGYPLNSFRLRSKLFAADNRLLLVSHSHISLYFYMLILFDFGHFLCVCVCVSPCLLIHPFRLDQPLRAQSRVSFCVFL